MMQLLTSAGYKRFICVENIPVHSRLLSSLLIPQTHLWLDGEERNQHCLGSWPSCTIGSSYMTSVNIFQTPKVLVKITLQQNSDRVLEVRNIK